jgi:hypothetical protein
MSKSLVDALGEGAWSVSAVIFDLNDMVDDEGRPISERRADAVVRAGVEMEMRQCPYAGIRHNRWMNVSALAQISRYYNAVLGEMAAFRRQTEGANATWADILACVIDLLARPAIYLLQQRNAQGPVPAQMAVGHKLAAGFFGVLCSLHERLALGVNLPVTVENFLNLVDEMGALVGASEACAGSPQMIRKASTALLEGASDDRAELDRLRLDMARCLALQVQLGIFWNLYDRVHLWSLVRGDFRERLIPCNSFLVRKLESARNDMDALAPPRPNGAVLPDALDAQRRDRLADALLDAADPQTLEEDLRTATELLNAPGSAIRYDGAAAPFALRVASYLNARRLFVAELSRLELELRGHLAFPSDTPIRLGAAVFPAPQALPWYELILGRRLGAHGHLTGNSTGVRVVAPTAAP